MCFFLGNIKARVACCYIHILSNCWVFLVVLVVGDSKMAQWVKRFAAKLEDLSLNPQNHRVGQVTPADSSDLHMLMWHGGTCLKSQHLEAGRVRGHPWLHSKFEARLDSMRPCLKERKGKEAPTVHLFTTASSTLSAF